MSNEVFDELQRRWKPAFDAFVPRRLVDNALGFGRVAAARRQEIAKNPELTDLGARRELRREFARNGIPRALQAARERVQAAEDDLKRSRDALGWPQPAADPLAEQRRAEVRRQMQGTSPAQIIAMALSDPAAAEALLDAPSRSMLPLPPAAMEQIRTFYAREKQGAQVAAIAVREEAVELAKASVETAARAVRAEVGLDERGFTEWVASGGVEPKAEAA